MKFHMLKLSNLENCPVCGVQPTSTIEPLGDKFFEETCARDGRRNFIISPKKRIEINLEELRMILAERGFTVKTSGPLGITFKQSEDVIACILKSGIMITQTSPDLKDNPKDDVFETYKSLLIDGLGLPHDILPEA
jgi:hypothetical protein